MSLLQGVELYSTSVGPENPNLQFDLSVTTTLQQQYDQGYNQASSLYGSILNAQVTRLDNAKAKEEYLSIIEKDLKKLGKINFGISRNVQATQKLFENIYKNKNLTKDIVWTQNFNSELAKAESLRNSPNVKSGQSQYWDEGVKYMQYKKQEFQKASSEEALSFEDVSYIPYNSVMDKAMSKLKESGLNIEYDNIQNGYKITTKNGEALKSPMTVLFNETIGNDPTFIEMFKVKSYVDRKDWVTQKQMMGEYSSEEEANLNYLNNISKVNLSRLDKAASDLQVDRGYLNQKVEALIEEYNTGGFEEGSDKYNYLKELMALKESNDQASGFVNQLQSISASGDKSSLNVLVQNVDLQNAFSLFQNDISQAVDVLAFKDAEIKMEADPFALKEYDHKLKLKEMAQAFSYDVQLENVEAANDFQLAKYKSEHSEKESSDWTATSDFNSSVEKASVPYNEVLLKLYSKSKGNELLSLSDLEEFKQSNEAAYKTLTKEANTEILNRKREANKKSAKIGEAVPFPEAVSPADLKSEEFVRLHGGDKVTALDFVIENVFNSYNGRYENDPKINNKLNDVKRQERFAQELMKGSSTKSANSIFYNIFIKD
jgi:hypothetical protein